MSDWWADDTPGLMPLPARQLEPGHVASLPPGLALIVAVAVGRWRVRLRLAPPAAPRARLRAGAPVAVLAALCPACGAVLGGQGCPACQGQGPRPLAYGPPGGTP